MKKLLFIALSALAFASCTDNIDNNTGDGGNNGSTDSVTYTVEYAGGAEGTDNMRFYDMKVTYRDADGELVEETVTEYPFMKRITGVKAPFTAEITPAYTLKDIEDIANDKDRFKVCELHFYINYKSSDGQISSEGTHTASMTLPLEKAYEYIKAQIERNNGKTFKVGIE